MTVAIGLALMVLVANMRDDGSPPGMHQARPSEFNFAGSWDGPCAATRARKEADRGFAAACKRWSEPQYFHGVWEVGFETSNFTFMGKMDCKKMQDNSCIDLEGEALPKRPPYDCNREFELKFVGRRSLYAVPGHLSTPTFAVTVDRVISARLLPTPYNWQCPGLPEEG